MTLAEELVLVFERVKCGERVEVKGLGVFYRSTSKARTIADPITRERVNIPASWRVAFRASKHWKGRQ